MRLQAKFEIDHSKGLWKKDMHGERSVNDEEVRTDKLRKDTSHAITVFLAQNRILNCVECKRNYRGSFARVLPGKTCIIANGQKGPFQSNDTRGWLLVIPALYLRCVSNSTDLTI